MVLFPNCKINLGLNIVRKRDDGYHDLQTAFYPVALKDALEIVRHTDTTSSLPVAFSLSGLPVAGEDRNNLCIKAYFLLQKDFPELPPIRMHLHKAIPMGAGLGGGSADGAFALLLLNEKFGLALSKEQLIAYALELGSDCPFFIHNKPSLATGRGEKMEEIALDLSDYKIVLAHPGIHVSTAWAFSQIIPAFPETSLKTLIQLPVAEWKNRLVNDFEAPVISQYPAIGRIKEELYENGALYASMSGSGSTIFGIFEKDTNIKISTPCIIHEI